MSESTPANPELHSRQGLRPVPRPEADALVFEDDICWIAECEICETPMVVWRFHGTAPPEAHVAHMRERLREVATAQLGEFWVDGHMRNIPDHFHAHARPKDGFYGRDRKR